MSKVWKLCWIIFSIASLAMPLMAKPCFITNCPPGGKRSDRFVSATEVLKEQEQPVPLFKVAIQSLVKTSLILGPFQICAKCGPSEDGTCFGASICCGSRFGCFFNSKETSICLLNNLTSSQACDEQFWRLRLKARTCSLSPNNLDGVCVSDGLCCSLSNLNSYPIVLLALCNWNFPIYLAYSDQCKRNLSCQHVPRTRFGPRTVDDLEPFTHHKYLAIGSHD